MEILNNIREIKNNWQPYKVWEAEQQKNERIDNILRKKNPPTCQEIKKAKQYSKTIVNAIDIMDRNAIDKMEDVSLVIRNYSSIIALGSMILGVGLGALVKKSSLSKKLPDWRPYWELLGIIVTSAISSIGLNIWQTNIAKKTARLARFDTRNNELKDYKNFIPYTDEQIKIARELSKNDDENIEISKNILERKNFQPIRSHKEGLVTKKYLDNKVDEYENWKKSYIEKEKDKSTYFKELEKTLTKEDLIQAEKERNAILHAVKNIEKKSNEYSINMKIASFGLTTIVTAIGTAIGGIIAGGIALIQKKHKIPKNINNSLKVLQMLLVTIIPGIATIITTAPTVKLTKDAARIGRFKAKQELINNPEFFITYSDEERKKITVPEVKIAKDSFWQELKKDIKSLQTLRKDAKEYFNYLETGFKEEQKIQKVLKTLKITEAQKQEAKKYQQQLFYAFEKVDEKQVSFTEDTDAILDIARTVGVSIINFGLKIMPIYASAKDVKSINNGKMPETLKEVLKIMTSGKLKPSTIATILLPFIVPKFLNLYAIIKGIQIEKQASMIGIMSAMNDLNDPKNFIINNEK